MQTSSRPPASVAKVMPRYLSTSLPLSRQVPNGNCSNDVPVQPSYLHSAYCNNFEQLVCTWSGDTATGPPLATPQWAQQHHHSPTHDVLNSQADFRLQAHMQAPPPPLDEETPMEDVGQEAGLPAGRKWIFFPRKLRQISRIQAVHS